MSVAIWATLALAAPPAGQGVPDVQLVDDGSLVQQVTWARPFRLNKPHPYRYASQQRSVTEGWLVELAVAPWTQRAGPMVPNLWIGSTMAGRLRWNSECAVVWVPGAHDLATEPVFFGTLGLPEQIGPDETEVIVARGRSLPQPTRIDVKGPVIEVEDFRGIASAARTRCSTDRPR